MRTCTACGRAISLQPVSTETVMGRPGQTISRWLPIDPGKYDCPSRPYHYCDPYPA